MKIIYAYHQKIGFVKVPIDTLKEFKQVYKDHKIMTKEEWDERKAV